MKKILKNEQYNEFILSEVVRPYQNMLFPNAKRFETLTYTNKLEKCFPYGLLKDLPTTNPDWWDRVTNRIVGIYSNIDYSFFRQDYFALKLQVTLIQKGIEPLNINSTL